MGSTTQHVIDALHDQSGRGEGVVSVELDGASVSVDVENSERYAVGVRGITVKPEQPVTDIRETAERVAKDVRGLGEPLAIVECEVDEGRAVVRSSEPEQDAAGVTYWEADIQRDQTTLHRYRKEHTADDRRVVTEPLLHSTVGHAVEQLVDAVKQTP